MAVWNYSTLKEVYSAGRFDAEYYSPAYTKNDEMLSRLNIYSISKHFTISDGNHMSVAKYFTEENEGIPYYRGQDINSYYLTSSSPVKIPPHIYNKSVMKRSYFLANDVLLSIVGTIGSLSIVPETFGPATGSCKIAILRSKGKMDPYYLSVFLLTSFGQLQIKRNTRGAVQMGLILEDIPKLKIPHLDVDTQNNIAELAKKSIELYEKSFSLYNQAQELLEHELGLDKLVFEKSLSYEASFSEIVGNNRADADYYQIPYRTLNDHISKLKTIRLGSICNFYKGIEVGSEMYKESGIPFLRVSNIKESGITFGNSDKYISNTLFSSLTHFQPRTGELLLTKDGTPGVCYCLNEEIDGIISGGIVRLVPQKDCIPMEYLALVINSKICRMQVEQECSGALIVHWKPESIRKLQIPILDSIVMKNLSDMIITAKLAQKESKQFLEQAKQRVEELIDEAVKK